jgi:hypothetical protein
VASATVSKPVNPEMNMKLFLNNMHLRLRAIEKECSLMKSIDIEEVRRRMTRLEQLHEKQQREMGSFTMPRKI